jgi:hypothetical protein
MKPTELVTKAFLSIQSDPVLWQAWNNAKEEAERQLMLMEAAYNLGLKDAK